MYLDLRDCIAAELFWGRFKDDRVIMSQVRAAFAETESLVFRLSDDDVIARLASQMASGQLPVKDPNQRWNSGLELPIQRPVSGYFMMLKYVLRARSFEHLQDLAGYRRGRLSAKGLFIYRFLRLREINEFEVEGSTITSKHGTPGGRQGQEGRVGKGRRLSPKYQSAVFR